MCLLGVFTVLIIGFVLGVVKVGLVCGFHLLEGIVSLSAFKFNLCFPIGFPNQKGFLLDRLKMVTQVGLHSFSFVAVLLILFK